MNKMKIVVLVGPGEVKKRDQLIKTKTFYSPDSITQVNLKTESLEKLKSSLSLVSLFDSGRRLVIAENAPDSLDLVELNSADKNLELLILPISNSVASTLIKSAKTRPEIVILTFTPEAEVSAFPYLDHLIEGQNNSFVELKKLQEEYGGQYILTMIYYLLRRNFLPQKSSFMESKVKKQKTKYPAASWSKLYRLALEADFKIKTGSLPEDLALTSLTRSWRNFADKAGN